MMSKCMSNFVAIGGVIFIIVSATRILGTNAFGLLLTTTPIGVGWVVAPRRRPVVSVFVTRFMSHQNASNEISDSVSGDDNDGSSDDNNIPKKALILDDVQRHMATLRSKYPTQEADYLAAARARNAAKTPSTDRLATDEDFQSIAKEKKQLLGSDFLTDDWEASMIEAGNAESQILIPANFEANEDEGEEPRLLLF